MTEDQNRPRFADRQAASASRRALLIGAAVLPALALPVLPAVGSSCRGGKNPDADLIALCARHPALIAAFNAEDGDGSDSDPLWLAYSRSRDAISQAKPQTLAGMRAKATVARAEALCPDGSEQPSGTMAEPWSWDLVNDLLRLTGGAA